MSMPSNLHASVHQGRLMVTGREILLRLRQKEREDHECDEALDRETYKSRPVSKMMDDQARQCRTEGGTDTHERAEHALGEIEASGAFRHIGDDQSRHHPDHGPSDTIQYLNGC